MTIPQLIMWAVIFGIGVPSAWRNPTAAALVISWLTGEVIYAITGDGLAVEFYLFPDIFVIAMVMAKDVRSVADRIVLSIYPICWVLYVADVHPFYKWYLLWGLTISQFLAVGWESFSIYRRSLHAASDTPDNPGALLVAYEGGGYG